MAAAILDEVERAEGAMPSADYRRRRPASERLRPLPRAASCSTRRLRGRRDPAGEGPPLEPDKSSIREALGRAYFRSARFDEARDEFAAVVERYPVNDFAHFCLGRSLEKTGRARRRAATPPWPPACARTAPDYQAFRDRLQAA